MSTNSVTESWDGPFLTTVYNLLFVCNLILCVMLVAASHKSDIFVYSMESNLQALVVFFRIVRRSFSGSRRCIAAGIQRRTDTPREANSSTDTSLNPLCT